MINKKIASELAVGIVLIIALVFGGIFLIQKKDSEGIELESNNINKKNTIVKNEKAERNEVVCAQDVKLCEDGSYVSRTGPNCEFSLCPKKNQEATKNEISFDLKRPDEPYDDNMVSLIKVLKEGNALATVSYKGVIGEVDLLKEYDGGIYFVTRSEGLGGYLIYVGYDGLYRLNFSDNSIDELISETHHLSEIEISADNKKVAYHDDKNIVIKSLDTNMEVRYDLPSKEDGAQFGNFKFSPNMDKLAIGAGYGPDVIHGEIYVLNLADKKYSKYTNLDGGTIVINGWKDNEEIDWKKLGN